GRELIALGYANDVKLSSEVDVSGTVPRLVGEGFAAAQPYRRHLEPLAEPIGISFAPSSVEELMRVICGLILLLFLATPGIASAQSFVLQGSAGPTLGDSGYSLAGENGYSPRSHLSVLFDVECTHLSSRLSNDGRGGFSG